MAHHSPHLRHCTSCPVSSFPASKMEAQHAAPVPRPRRNKQLPTKQLTSVKKKKSVSVVATLKRQPERSKDVFRDAKPPTNLSKAMQKHAPSEETQSLHSGPSSRSPQKAAHKVSKKKSEMHPLAVAYTGTSGIATDRAERQLKQRRNQRRLSPPHLQDYDIEDQQYARSTLENSLREQLTSHIIGCRRRRSLPHPPHDAS